MKPPSSSPVASVRETGTPQGSFAHLPGSFRRFIGRLKAFRIPPAFIFLVIGMLATVWFLVRVIPKPSRAAYPCMRATAPFMSGFVIWLLGMAGSAVAMRNYTIQAARRNPLAAMAFLVLAGGLFIFSTVQFPSSSRASAIKSPGNWFTPNAPIGQAQGIFPGRVVWMWDPRSTNEHCTNTSNNNGVIDPGDDAWFMEKNHNPDVIDTMVAKSLRGVAGTGTSTEAWDRIFRYFNIRHGKGDIGYQSGEKIFLKINVTSAYGPLAGGRYNADLGRTDNQQLNNFDSETDPYLVLSMIKQLVDSAGVPDSQIWIGDPARNVYKEQFDLWKGAFPGLHILGNDLTYPELQVAALGRTPVAVTAGYRVVWSDHGTAMPEAIRDKLFTIAETADYLINIPTMKAHATGGITLAAKNHFGSFTRPWAMHLHSGLMDGIDDPLRLGYGLYRVQTDIMMHNLLGGKNLLIVVDGLYPGEDALATPDQWSSPPFNNDWASSVFMSLDPVAIESVCHDFLRTEYNGPATAQSRPNWFGVDDYLHQAADSALWPDGIIYDPDTNNILISSLGVHEHWNDSLNKQYTRNLGTGDGIELYKAHEIQTGMVETGEAPRIVAWPNPAGDEINIRLSNNSVLNIRIYNVEGTEVRKGRTNHAGKAVISLAGLPPGVYIISGSGNLHRQFLLRFVKR